MTLLPLQRLIESLSLGIFEKCNQLILFEQIFVLLSSIKNRILIRLKCFTLHYCCLICKYRSIHNFIYLQACHPLVNPRKYYQACVFDACACDSGGDCECLCTAIHAYAQECNRFGVHIYWRSQSLCRKYKLTSCFGSN